MKSRLLGGAAFLCAVSSVSANADTLGEDAAAFGARETVADIALSPSGNKVMFVEPGSGSDETIFVVDLAGDPTPRALVTSNEAQARLNGCNWATENAIVCTIYGYVTIGGADLGFTRVIAVDAASGKVTQLTAGTDYKSYGTGQFGGSVLALDVDGEPGRIMMSREFVKESSVNTRLYNDDEGLGVDLVDVTNGRRKITERPVRNAADFVADEHGELRLMVTRSTEAGRFSGNDLKFSYRPLGAKGWEPLSTANDANAQLTGFEAVAVDSKQNLAYGFETIDGYLALVTMTLDGNATRTVVKQRGDVDVDGLVRIGRDRRIVGVSYATEKRLVEYFDPELDRLAGALSRALPGRPLVSIVDASDDESKLLMIASSDTDPGMVYLYDKASKQLSELMPVRQPLDGRAFGEMKPITYAAADGTQIPGYLTLPPGSDGRNLPAIVMPHGGPGSRDEWGFDWLVQFFAAQGYAVLQPNFRGSAGYGDKWFGRNGFKAWETAIGDVDGAGRWLVQQGIADPARLGIVGWSYGGYAALQSQVVDPGLFKAVVAIAPVTDLGVLKEENRNYTSFAQINDFVGSGPHIESGSPARHAAAFQSPVLLVHGTMDMNVDSNQSVLMKRRLEEAGKKVDYLEFEGLDHGLVHAQARGIMLRRIGDFLTQSMP